MSMRINIENILNSDSAIFKEILSKLTQNSIDIGEKELKRDIYPIDTVLCDAIKLVLKNLYEEEGYISRLLYSLFNINFTKNKRREQLIILGGQLKSQYKEIQKEIKRTEYIIELLNSSLRNLNILQKAFNDKNRLLLDKTLLQKSKNYLKQISIKIETINRYKSSLKNRLKILTTNRDKYYNLLRKIPRYQELREDKYLLLK